MVVCFFLNHNIPAETGSVVSDSSYLKSLCQFLGPHLLHRRSVHLARSDLGSRVIFSELYLTYCNEGNSVYTGGEIENRNIVHRVRQFCSKNRRISVHGFEQLMISKV